MFWIVLDQNKYFLAVFDAEMLLVTVLLREDS